MIYDRCTRIKNPADEVAQIFAKIPVDRGGGVKAFQIKLPQGVHYFEFNCIFINKSLKICLEGS